MVKTTEFKQLVKAFCDDQLNEVQLAAAVVRFFENNLDINPTDVLGEVQSLLDDGSLSPESFRLLVQMVTEINIQRAINNSRFNLGKDETLVMQSQGAGGETLIIPGKRRKSMKPDAGGSQLEVGHVIKNRFELVEIIGKGGMGVVYKARDLVKVQARDSHPFVAVKVLSEGFKKYSRAFIALQREASKSQRLAHPNIATVFDFDRDNDTIFMTMELLSGQPFDKLITRLSERGLPKETALRYIDDLCNGLAYAHKQGLVHSDLKPANIYLCDSGAVKLLDFGITRAIKQDRPETEDDTLFDPATLKALTPAYATIEMFERGPPDPRDDIYALACVSFELLTGTHPYKKVAAHKALELGLKPPRVKGLSRQQQNALVKALALHRGERTATVEEFRTNILPPKSHARELLLAAVSVLLLTGIFLGGLVYVQSGQDEQTALIQRIQNGDRQQLEELLAGIGRMDRNNRELLLYMLRREIIRYFEERINDLTNIKARHYNFPEASRLLREIKQLYPDSVTVAEAEQRLQQKKDRLVETLLQNYKELSSANQGTERVLQILREVDPGNALLKEPAPTRDGL
ncbi:MAG TPA: serine/threonine-protein kinase [Gammaproteobacteria bacterium]|nr:serine/threonine-protein kinase [Gammaproteobacteria bacterium]